MKIEKKYTLGLFDVDSEFKLKIQSAARLFQEMATYHSTKIGAGPNVLFKMGVVWFLHRLEIEIFRYPLLGENLTMTTWSRGFKGFKGFREFNIQSSKGDIARGSSVWLFFNTKRKRISKVPDEISKLYEFESEKWFKKEINDHEFCGKIEPEKEIDISLRYSDFDVNGHVNNTVYLGFLETLYHKSINGNGELIKNIKIRFSKEIGSDRHSVRVGWQKNNGVYHCNIFDNSTLYADAQMIPMD
ncbi:MAG: hypothetical protein GY699_06905 [Desulfobacteraceae bacterium]|nr:hypothetical protein [Desulfobacteraceae bacterium]